MHTRDLEPKIIWNHFEDINAVPRPSKHEERIIQFMLDFGNNLGLEVHAGHGLTFHSSKILSKIKGIQEFNIGHFLIGESIFIGLTKTIKLFKKILKK